MTGQGETLGHETNQDVNVHKCEISDLGQFIGKHETKAQISQDQHDVELETLIRIFDCPGCAADEKEANLNDDNIQNIIYIRPFEIEVERYSATNASKIVCFLNYPAKGCFVVLFE